MAAGHNVLLPPHLFFAPKTGSSSIKEFLNNPSKQGKDFAGRRSQDKSWREKEFGRVSSFRRTSLPLSGAGHWQGFREEEEPNVVAFSILFLSHQF